MYNKLLAVVFSLFSLTPVAVAEPVVQPQHKMSAEEFLASLHFQSGKITLPGSIATLDLPSHFRYLDPDDTQKVLVQAWGNPPGAKTLGMIFSTDTDPLAKDRWGVVVTYEKGGHVKDDDADGIDYADLLKTMQDQEQHNNDERKKQGYPSLNLVGWAEPPAYDKANHKLYWAKNIRFSDVSENTLNYNVRVLGREGVLVLNAVAGMDQITTVKEQMKEVNRFAEFTTGNRYSDFNSSTDKVAEYGIAALITGGIAAKLGLFGKLIAVLIAAKKLIFVAIAAAAGYVLRLFKGRQAPSDK
jgi:uncharacterized membrane-anchored protein